AFAGFILPSFFRVHHSGRMYFFDLTGAVLGIMASIVLIPMVRIENCVFIAGSAMAVWGIIYTMKTRGIKHRNTLICFLGILLAAQAGFLTYNLYYDGFNIAKISYRYTRKESGLGTPKKFNPKLKSRLEFSQDTLIQRIDVYSAGKKRKNVSYNGYSNDSIYNKPKHRYRYDQRIIHDFIEKPRVLVVGAAAEGILKPLKNETEASLIDAIEINPAIINIMEGRYQEFSGFAYLGINIIKNDANTYLFNTEKKYDLITLLNTHMVKSIDFFGGPEFLMTEESIRSYFDHLTEDGHIMIEERGRTSQAKHSFYRILATFYHAMKAGGIENPQDNIFIYAHHYSRNRLARIEQISSSNYYINAMFKNTPITQKDLAVIKQWKRWLPRVHYLYIPGIDTGNETYSDLFEHLKQGKPYYKKGNLTPITDNRPYPFDIDRQINIVSQMFWKVSAILLAFFIIFLSFTHKNEYFKKDRLQMFCSICFFGLTGLSYLFVELFFMQYYHKFTGGPTNALIFIMGSLLTASGIGAYCIQKIKKKMFMVLISLIPMGLLFHYFINRHIVLYFCGTPLVNSLVIGISMLPLGFVMGLPFPYMLEHLKSRINAAVIPHLFVYNLLFGAFGIMLSIYLSICYGFGMTFFIGFFSYLVIICLAWILLERSTIQS
ncbi:MAG: hypothetical protein GY797_36095, partial [Deltaproteobacteria bacterium]|nr:hypothetical protein [Deltaproteobacteria bacterium]